MIFADGGEGKRAFMGNGIPFSDLRPSAWSVVIVHQQKLATIGPSYRSVQALAGGPRRVILLPGR